MQNQMVNYIINDKFFLILLNISFNIIFFKIEENIQIWWSICKEF